MFSATSLSLMTPCNLPSNRVTTEPTKDKTQTSLQTPTTVQKMKVRHLMPTLQRLPRLTLMLRCQQVPDRHWQWLPTAS